MSVPEFVGAGVNDGVRELSLAESPLAALKDAFAKVQQQDDEIRLTHPGAAHIEFVFNRRTVVDYDLLSAMQKASQQDFERFACTLLANACEDIVVDGKSTGYTLSSEEVRELTGTVDTPAAVRAFFNGNFLWLQSVAQDLISKAAKGDGDPVDPTRAGR